MTRSPAREPKTPSRLGIHLRVILRAVPFGLGAYAGIHGLIWLVDMLRNFPE